MFVSVYHLLGILVPYYIYLLTAPSFQSEVLSKGIGLFQYVVHGHQYCDMGYAICMYVGGIAGVVIAAVVVAICICCAVVGFLEYKRRTCSP